MFFRFKLEKSVDKSHLFIQKSKILLCCCRQELHLIAVILKFCLKKLARTTFDNKLRVFHQMRSQSRYQVSKRYQLRSLPTAQHFALDKNKVQLSDSEAVIVCRQQLLPHTKIEKTYLVAVLTRTSFDS